MDDPENERIRQCSLSMDAIMDEFSDSGSSYFFNDLLIEAERNAILADIDESLSQVDEQGNIAT